MENDKSIIHQPVIGSPNTAIIVGKMMRMPTQGKTPMGFTPPTERSFMPHDE